MPNYLVQASYNSEGIASLTGNPGDRAAAVRQVVEGLDGKLDAFYYALGKFDVAYIDVAYVIEMPDNATMAALSMAVSAGGAVKDLNTTSILSIEESEESIEAMHTRPARWATGRPAVKKQPEPLPAATTASLPSYPRGRLLVPQRTSLTPGESAA